MQSYKDKFLGGLANAATAIKNKVAQINPFKKFIKFTFEQLSNQLIKDQKISYESLISGIIELPNLELDTQKINKKYFFATPYTLHSGNIAHLKIMLPSLTQIAQGQRIEVQISKIFLSFEPIQNFQENFIKIMEEIKQFLYFFVQEKTSDYFVIQKGSKDHFKETLKQMLCNIRVRVEDIALSVNLQNQPKKDSFSMLLKIPLINVHRGSDSQNDKTEHLGKEQFKEEEEINFDCQIPQFSVHLMDSSLESNEGFPFAFPLYTHSSTLLMFGISQYEKLNIQTHENVPRFNFSITKNNQSGLKKFKLSFKFPQLEFMLDPNQIMILIQFAKQINAFNHRLEALKKSLNTEEPKDQNQQQQQPQQSGLRRNRSNLYSSVSISLLESSVFNISNIVPKMKKTNSPPQSVIDSVIQKNMQSNDDLFKSIQNFNDFVEQTPELKVERYSINQNSERQPQVQYIKFKDIFEVHAQVKSILVCIQKYNSKKDVEKIWNFQKESPYPKLFNSYFFLSIQGIKFNLNEDQSVEFKMKDFKFQQVKFKTDKQPETKKTVSMMNSQGQIDQFSDVRSSQKFYSQSQVSLVEPKIQPTQHYCIDEILYIGNSTTSMNHKKNSGIQQHNMSKLLKTNDQNNLYKEAIIFHSVPPHALSNKYKEQVNSIQITGAMIKLTTQLVKEIVDLYVMIQKQVFQLQQNQEKPKDPVVSQKQQQKEKGAAKNVPSSTNVTMIKIQELIIGYLEQDITNFKSCVEKYQNDIDEDYQTCFCNTNTQAVYLKIEGTDFRKVQKKNKLCFNKLGLGFAKIVDSKMSQIFFFMRILETTHENQMKRSFKLSYEAEKKNVPAKIGVVGPQIIVEIKESSTLHCIEFVHNQLQNLKSELIKLTQTNEKPIPKPSKNLQTQSKTEQKASLKPIVSLFVEKIKFKFINAEAEVHNLCFFKEPLLLSLKFSAFVLYLGEPISFYTGQMRNQQIIRKQCQKRQKYPQVFATTIALNFYAPPSPQLKLVEQKMLYFLTKISKADAPFQLIIKNPELPGTDQISVSLKAPIYVNSVILLRIAQSQELYHKFFEKVNVFVVKITSFLKEIFPPNQLKNLHKKEVSTSKDIQISKGTIKIDTRPTFHESPNNYDPKSKDQHKPKQVVFSNTRSFLQLSWEPLKVQIEEKRTYFEGSVNMGLYFRFDQNHLQDKFENVEGDLKEKGFYQVFKIQAIKNKIEMLGKKVRVNIQIENIQSQITLEILGWLNLHFKHLLNHNIKRNLGFTLKEQEDRTEELNIDDYDFSQEGSQIVNLDNGYQTYTEKEKRKKEFEEAFKNEKIVPPIDQNCELFIESFAIHSILVKIIKPAQPQASIELTAKNLQIKGKITEVKNASLKLYGSINQLSIIHENQKVQGGLVQSLINYWKTYKFDKFTVFSNHSPITFLLNKDNQKTYLKFADCFFDLGFRSTILEIKDVYALIKNEIIQSGWKKIYEEKLPLKISNPNLFDPLLLISIPKNKMNVSLTYDIYPVLQNQTLRAPEFILHEQIDKPEKIQEYVNDWVLKLLEKNLLGLVLGASLNNFGLLKDQIVNLISFLLSCIF